MDDLTRLENLPPAELRERRDAVVKEIDELRFEVARGLIGVGRTRANRRISSLRQFRDGITALIEKSGAPPPAPPPEKPEAPRESPKRRSRQRKKEDDD